MRLWHVDLLPLLPRPQLLGQHREVCALRGNGWGKRHSVVDYVFTHRYAYLHRYHVMVMNEMRRRGYNVDYQWFDREYRGKAIGLDRSHFTQGDWGEYPEHDAAYMAECVANLAEKGITLDVAL